MSASIAPEFRKDADAKDLRAARDLRTEPPRSPRETLGGYVIAARVLDKCRALLNGTNGEYQFNGFMDTMFFTFSGINADDFKAFVATGASDDEVGEWIRQHAKQKDRLDVVTWNNACRYKTIRDMPDSFQAFMEGYIAQHLPKHRPVYHVFDVFDLEEGRL
jgi:hypothetical protein